MWVTWYLDRFTSGDPFRRRRIDVKTVATELVGGGYANAAKRNMPPSRSSGRRHTSVAVEDAFEQGKLVVQIIQTLRKERRVRLANHAYP